MDDLTILTECALFHGLREAQIREMLPCLSARQSRFRRGQFLLRAGDRVAFAGILLSGEAEVLQEDFWGNRNLLAAVGPGDLFAEAFACAHAVSPVSVLCKTDGSVLYLNVRAVFSPCEKACAQHKALSQNLIRVLAEKNMQLNEKAGFLSQRTTREKLLAYLSAQARRAGSASFRIPFDRQQLADFLSVNRSAMSAVLLMDRFADPRIFFLVAVSDLGRIVFCGTVVHDQDLHLISARKQRLDTIFHIRR